MMNRIHSSAPTAAAGSAMVAIELTNALTILGVMVSFLSVKVLAKAITKTFSSPQQPYQTIAAILMIALIGAFLQAGFMWGGKLMISPMAIFLMTAIMLIFLTTYERILALEKASTIFVYELTKMTVLAWLVCGGAAWFLFHFEQEIVNIFWKFIDNRPLAKAIAHTSSAILLVLVFIRVMERNLYINAMGNTKKYFISNLDDFVDSHSEQEVKSWVNNASVMMESISPIIHKSTPAGGGYFAVMSYSALTAAIYSFIAWYFGHINIMTYNASLF